MASRARKVTKQCPCCPLKHADADHIEACEKLHMVKAAKRAFVGRLESAKRVAVTLMAAGSSCRRRSAVVQPLTPVDLRNRCVSSALSLRILAGMISTALPFSSLSCQHRCLRTTSLLRTVAATESQHRNCKTPQHHPSSAAAVVPLDRQ